MIVRHSKNGRYARCQSCKKTVDLEPPKHTKNPCPKCKAPATEKRYKKDGKNKRFYKCTKCEWTDAGAPGRVRKDPCPACGKSMVERKSKKGKKFWACTGYPQCTEAEWIQSPKKRRATKSKAD